MLFPGMIAGFVLFISRYSLMSSVYFIQQTTRVQKQILVTDQMSSHSVKSIVLDLLYFWPRMKNFNQLIFHTHCKELSHESFVWHRIEVFTKINVNNIHPRATINDSGDIFEIPDELATTAEVWGGFKAVRVPEVPECSSDLDCISLWWP